MLPVETHIRETIQARGPITFSEFMEFALFSPLGGYYTSGERTGAGGDYYTSPTSHPLFGWLIAAQLLQMWGLLGRPDPFTVVEAGAGAGRLAMDIHEACDSLDHDLCAALRYVAIDRVRPSAPVSLPMGATRLVAQAVPLRRVVGCVLSNELFDCFPVHRFSVSGGRVLEVYVGLADGELTEVTDAPSDPEISRRVQEATGGGLPEGYRGEVCLGLDPWLAGVSAAMRRGFVLTVDYGDTAKGLYGPGRSRGTLRSYYRHTVTGNPYVRVGRQDITAHVDFSELARAGRRHGLVNLGYATQGSFLKNLGADAYVAALARRGRLSGPTPMSEETGQREGQANRMAMAGLLDPEGLGGFRVLAQGKGVGEPALWGFDPDNPHRRGLAEQRASLAPPMRSSAHTPLMEGRYPHAAFGAEWEWGDGPPGEPR
jgi:SAM-dependent MidA family methyltransferase